MNKMHNQMLEILTTFTEESQRAALDKCSELSLDINRGIISLDESFINLNSAKAILIDSIENNKLNQLPISVQNILLSNLDAISKSLTGLSNGTDEVVNLVNNIEQLNVSIWQYGFHNLSDQLLGHLNKMNQLKFQEVEIAKLKRELEDSLSKKTDLEKLVINADSEVKNLSEIVTKSQSNLQKIEEDHNNTSQTSQKAASLLIAIEQNDVTSTQLLANTKVSSAEVIALEPKIKEFYSNIEQYRNDITKTTSDGQKAVKDNKEETDSLIVELKKLEVQIKDQIEKATGFSLFHSFQTRQLELASSKKIWIYALGGLVIASWLISIFVISTTTNIDVAFFGKLSLTVPLIYAIFFCTVQYGRERKLEEEYAFKSNISISLVPYKDLIEKLIDVKQTGEKEKYSTFLIDSITKVYTSPTDKIFDGEHKANANPNDVFKQLEKLINGLVEPLKPIFNILKQTH
jgi:hypothetical protein